MFNNPLVSIILSTYNRASYLKKSVESVLAQTYKNFELIIVNDISGDNTAEVVSGLMARDNRIKLIVNKNNLGLVKSANHGVAAARGQYIARIDDDDVWSDPKKLGKQISFLESHPDCVVVGGGVIRVDSQGKEIMRFMLPEHDKDVREIILINNPFAQSAVVFRKDAWEKAGGYDESLFYAEDWDLWFRIGKFGKMYNIQEYLVKYLQGSQNISNKKIMRNAVLNLKLRWKYRNDYPNLLRGYLKGIASLFLAISPFRRYAIVLLSKLKRTNENF